MKAKFIVAGVSAVALSASLALAGGSWWGDHHRGGGFFSDRGYHKGGRYHRGLKGMIPLRMLRDVSNLSDDQKDSIKTILEDHRDTMYQQKRQYEPFVGFSNDGFNEDAFKSDMIAKVTQRAKDGSKLIKDILAVLTKEQQTELFKEIAQVKEEFNAGN